jgi:hypothetical protein
VETSWTKAWFDFKSPLRVVVQFLLRSREATKEKCQAQKRKRVEAERLIGRQQAELERQLEEIRELKQHVRRLEAEKRQAEATIRLPDDPPVNGHGYGARMVSLAVELAKVVGLRGAARTLAILFEWLGVQQEIPHWSAIRMWVQRLGVAALKEPLEQADDWIWIVDHSNQIGAEKVLVVLAVRASQLPPPGEALKHEHVRVLTVQPGTTWKREDVAAVYTELAEQCGLPRGVVCDGAVELREGAECLKSLRADLIVLQDFKHKAANFLKALLGNVERFAEFNAQLGRTRSAIQQTELAHLTPPSQKQKARFMNLGATLEWAAVALWVIDHPQRHAHEAGVTVERLEEKLGWLRSFAEDLTVWRECQQVVNKGVTFINEQGIFPGAAEQLRAAPAGDSTHATSGQLAAQLMDFVADSEGGLKKGERLPMSTEILESSFALYKQLERQHSKGGFTSLLAGFGALLNKTTPETVKQAFSRASVKDVRQWVRDKLGHTLTSKRLVAYKEFKRATQGAKKLLAPT